MMASPMMMAIMAPKLTPTPEPHSEKNRPMFSPQLPMYSPKFDPQLPMKSPKLEPQLPNIWPMSLPRESVIPMKTTMAPITSPGIALLDVPEKTEVARLS